MDKLVKQHYNYRWLSWFGINAITIGNRIFYSCKDPPDWPCRFWQGFCFTKLGGVISRD